MNRNGQLLAAARAILTIVRNFERTGVNKTNLYSTLECKITQVELEIYSGQVDDEFAQEMVDNLFKTIIEDVEWVSVTIVK